jgi:acetyl esterase/lipase
VSGALICWNIEVESCLVNRLKWTVGVCLSVFLVSTPLVDADELYVQHKNLVYDEVHGIGLLMDVFVPVGAKNGYAIVDIASGAWYSSRDKIRDHKRSQTFDLLCERGFVVFAIRPGSITKFNAAEMVENTKSAIRWVKEHAGEYQIDPASLGLMGASAGGHLACLTAVTADDATKVKAVGVFFPPTDFLDYGGRDLSVSADEGMGRIVSALAFKREEPPPTDADSITAAAKAISPARLVPNNAPPFLLIHGDADPSVPLQQSEVMVAALKAKNIPVQLIIKQGGGHPWVTIHEEVEVLAEWFVARIVGEPKKGAEVSPS